MQPFLAPTLDIVFKLLFTRDAGSREALIGLLSAVLRPQQPITDIEVLNPAIRAGEIDDKDIVLDILVRLANGTTLNVEMQARAMDAFRERLLFYWARAFGQLLGIGEGYAKLRPTFVIAFLGYREEENPRFHAVFRLLDAQTGMAFSNALAIHLIQMPLLATLSDADRREEGALLHWSTFLAARTREEAEAAAMNDPAISKANDILERLTGDPEVQEMARRRELAQAARLITHGAIHEKARLEGEAIGLRAAVHALCAVLDVPLDEARRATLEAMTVAELSDRIESLRTDRAWR